MIYRKALKKLKEKNQYVDDKNGELLLTKIKHNNIIKYYGYFVDADGYLCFLLEFYKVSQYKYTKLLLKYLINKNKNVK